MSEKSKIVKQKKREVKDLEKLVRKNSPGNEIRSHSTKNRKHLTSAMYGDPRDFYLRMSKNAESWTEEEFRDQTKYRLVSCSEFEIMNSKYASILLPIYQTHHLNIFREKRVIEVKEKEWGKSLLSPWDWTSLSEHANEAGIDKSLFSYVHSLFTRLNTLF